MIDAASGGALVDKTPIGANDLIANMAANSQQFGTRQDIASTRKVNEVHTNDSQPGQQLAQLTMVVQQLVMGQHVRPCRICLVVGHTTDACPTLFEYMNSVGGFPGQPKPQYNPYSNSYNEGWRDHPNLR